MVSLPVLALILSVIAIVLAAGAIILVVDIRARVRTHEFARLEGQTSESASRTSSGNGPGTAQPALPGQQPISSRLRQVPETPPTAIAPGLQKPPRIKGGFGSQTQDASQLPPDNKTGRGEQDGGDTSAQSSSGPEDEAP